MSRPGRSRRNSLSETIRELVGVLNVRKERAWTSHDVVARVRRLSGQRRVGHAGTLDPLAEGVLPLLLGRATRLADFVGGGRKQYLAHIQLGAQTETDDAEGAITVTAPVPQLTPALVIASLQPFLGTTLQVPPSFSAVKIGGVRAYAAARKGEALDLAPRDVTIYDIALVELANDSLVLDVSCSRGTYIRSLARDLAKSLGTVGHLLGLVRTRVGPFSIAQAHSLGEVEQAGIERWLQAPDAVMMDAPSIVASAAEIVALSNGRPVARSLGEVPRVRVYDEDGLMRFVGSVTEGLVRARISLYPDRAQDPR